MEWLVEPFEPAFMQRALLAGSLTVVVCSVVGTWVVLRGLAFMGDALAHGVLPGIALAVVVGFDLTLGAMLGAVVMVAGVSVISRRSDLKEDTGIGLLFVGLLAVGVIIISRSRSFAVELTSLLFGNVLGVSGDDVWFLSAAAVVAVALTVALYRPLIALAFDERKARALGLRPGATHLTLLALIALAVVSSFRAVGTLLVFSLLVAPPATATLLVRRVPVVMAGAVAIGWIAVIIGLLLSWHLDLAAGASIAATSVALFFMTLGGREIARSRSRRQLAA